MSESGDQIHAATPARRQRAKKEGDVPKSFELAAAIQMIGALTVAFVLFSQIGQWLKSWTQDTWTDAGSHLSVSSAEFTGQIQTTLFSSLKVLAPIFGLFLLLGIASHWLQSGPLFLTGRIAPDLSRLGPTHFKKQFFSLSNLAIILVGIPRVLIAVIVLAASAWRHQDDFFSLAILPPDQVVQEMFQLILTISAHVAFALLITSAIDVGLKWASYQRRIRMTDQELRDELRMQNGGR